MNLPKTSTLHYPAKKSRWKALAVICAGAFLALTNPVRANLDDFGLSPACLPLMDTLPSCTPFRCEQESPIIAGENHVFEVVGSIGDICAYYITTPGDWVIGCRLEEPLPAEIAQYYREVNNPESTVNYLDFEILNDPVKRERFEGLWGESFEGYQPEPISKADFLGQCELMQMDEWAPQLAELRRQIEQAPIEASTPEQAQSPVESTSAQSGHWSQILDWLKDVWQQLRNF